LLVLISHPVHHPRTLFSRLPPQLFLFTAAFNELHAAGSEHSGRPERRAKANAVRYTEPDEDDEDIEEEESAYMKKKKAGLLAAGKSPVAQGYIKRLSLTCYDKVERPVGPSVGLSLCVSPSVLVQSQSLLPKLISILPPFPPSSSLCAPPPALSPHAAAQPYIPSSSESTICIYCKREVRMSSSSS
jgi:hypothetical protein